MTTFDEFIAAFGISEDLARPDWRLALDLTLLRTIELLDERGFFKRPDVQQELAALSQDEEEPEPVGAPEL